jgi:tRNA 2-selenouridine synthase
MVEKRGMLRTRGTTEAGGTIARTAARRSSGLPGRPARRPLRAHPVPSIEASERQLAEISRASISIASSLSEGNPCCQGGYFDTDASRKFSGVKSGQMDKPSTHKPSTHSVAMDAAILTRFDAILDARTPSEYAEDHVPDALSTPVLSDSERAEVGTLYKQVSAFEAKKLGGALVARNVAAHVERHFRDRPKGWRPLVYCWRGGKRSGAMAHILREIGWEAATLEGGYRAYRRWVVAELDRYPGRFSYAVVHGPTGSGKSRLLAALALAGAQVLDLEGLAAHRGSVLGHLPDRPQPSQKMFESRLLGALSRLDPRRTVFVEGESKKIGQLQVPDGLITRMRASRCIALEADAGTRVTLLLDEYRHFTQDRAALDAQLDCLVGLHGREKIAQWKALGEAGAWREFVSRLLLEHYDPAYRKSSMRNFPALADAERVRVDAPDAFAAIAARLASRERAAA